MIAVGIDQSYSGTGFIALRPDGNGGAEVVKETLIFDRTKDPHYVRAWAIASKVNWELLNITQYQPDPLETICVEGYAFGKVQGMAALGELGGQIKLAARGHKAPVVVPPTQVKKFASGRGVCGKEIVLKEVFRKWGYDTDDNNLADAYVLARIGLVLAGGAEPLTAYEREVIAAIKKEQGNGN